MIHLGHIHARPFQIGAILTRSSMLVLEYKYLFRGLQVHSHFPICGVALRGVYGARRISSSPTYWRRDRREKGEREREREREREGERGGENNTRGKW